MACASVFASGHAYAQVASQNVIVLQVNGQRIFQGSGAYDQIDYDGNSVNYRFVSNADGSVSVTKPDGVTDRLINIDGFWFSGEQQWYAIEDLVTPASTNQTITGSPNNYDQVDYPGNSRDYRFVRNSDASVSVTKPGGGIDRLINIDGFWFSGEARWYPIGELVAPASGNQTITGGTGYDQVDYPGAALDYTFTENANGSVRVEKPGGGIDTLIRIDGFWFQGEEAWYPIESLLAQRGQTIVGTNAYDQVDYDGSRADYIFVQNANGTVTVNRPGGLIDTLGNDLVRGLGGQDNLRVDGDVFEWTYAQNGDSLTMSHPTWGVNTLISMEQIFSLRSGSNFTINQAVASTNGLPAFRLDGDNVINGTPGNDFIPSQAGVQGFYGGLGNDTYQGTGNFEQVNYDGARAEYTFARLANGSIRVSHPIWGTDTLVNIDAVIFTGVEPGAGGARSAEFEFVSIGDLVG